MADSLIRTKLRQPFTRPALVPRPRLQQPLAQGLRGPLTLVVAPAGYGKTTLVACHLAQCDFPVAWLSLDKEDNQHGRFLRYLLAAMQTVDPVIGQEASRLLMDPQAPPALSLTSLVNDLDAACQEVALVLDDYHFITSHEVHTAVTFLLEHAPPTFHLVIASRSDPPLPTARLRARGQAVELRAADLRFTTAETAQFLNKIMDLSLDADAIALLEKRTEGWIAGLQLAALSMQGREDVAGFIAGFSGTNRHILDYLLEEVLAREPAAVQTFLLETAVLTRLSGPLCDAVTGAAHSAEMLDSLERRSLFVVPLDDERRWYRYHHLFADLLQGWLRQSGPEREARLLSRAARWCAQNGHVHDAIAYALAAQDFAHAAALVAQYWDVATGRGEIEMLWSWLQALPEATIRSSARLSITYCWALWIRGEMGAIAGYLSAAEHALRIETPSETPGGHSAAEDDGLPAELAALHAFVARHHDDFETAIGQAQEALRLMPEALPPQAGAQLRAVIFFALATAHDGAGNLEQAVEAYRQNIHWNRAGASATGVTGITYRLAAILRLLGRLRAAETACGDALAYIEAQGMTRLPAAGILHVALAEVLVEQNKLAAAEKRLGQGMALGRGSGRLDAKRNAAFALSRLRLAQQDGAGALTAVQEAKTALGPAPSPLALAELLALEAGVHIRQGAIDEAAYCVTEAQRLGGWDKGLTGELVSLAAARLLCAQDTDDKTVPELTQAIAAAELSGRLSAAIELHILRSLALARQGVLRAAGADVEAALALAAPEGYVRLFLDEGRPMQRLLTWWLAQAADGALRDYAVDLLALFAVDRAGETAVFPKPSTAHIPDLVETLSPRELDVLQVMALGRTNREIAAQLVISPGTVKAHTASIYRKLDVANRTEAVARARQFGILP